MVLYKNLHGFFGQPEASLVDERKLKLKNWGENQEGNQGENEPVNEPESEPENATANAHENTLA